MVTDNCHIRHPEAVKDVAHTLEFGPHAEIRHVAGMQHEIDVVAFVQRLDGFGRLVVPALRVADDGKTHAAPSCRRRLDTGNVVHIDARGSGDTRIVGMVFDLAGRQRQDTCARQGQSADTRNDTLSHIQFHSY